MLLSFSRDNNMFSTYPMTCQKHVHSINLLHGSSIHGDVYGLRHFIAIFSFSEIQTTDFSTVIQKKSKRPIRCIFIRQCQFMAVRHEKYGNVQWAAKWNSAILEELRLICFSWSQPGGKLVAKSIRCVEPEPARS